MATSPRDRTLVALLGMSQLGRSRLQPSRSPYSRFSPSRPAFQAKRPGCPRLGATRHSQSPWGRSPSAMPCRTQGFLRPTTGHTVGRAAARAHRGPQGLGEGHSEGAGGCWTDCRHSARHAARSLLRMPPTAGCRGATLRVDRGIPGPLAKPSQSATYTTEWVVKAQASSCVVCG